MPKVVVSKHIDAPAQEVFEVFTNFAAAPARIRGIKRLEVLTEGPVGVGTRFRETRVMLGKEATEEMEITQFDRPHRYVVEAESCGCHYLSEFKFTPEGMAPALTPSLAVRRRRGSLSASLRWPI